MPGETNAVNHSADIWSTWLLERRHGGDVEYQRRMRTVVETYRDRVLDGARLTPGMTLADIGTGDGLIAFGAIARVGKSLRVILTDVSLPLLQHTEKLAIRLGVQEQCSFIAGSAERLDAVDDGSIDALTTRAVLAYVGDKAGAFREFYRVLKTGGRISLAEPIFQDDALEVRDLANFIRTQPNHPEANFLRLVHRYRAAQIPSAAENVLNNPLTNYNERDMFRFARDAGFVNIHLELHIDLRAALEITWEAHLDVATHPWAPTLRDILTKHFSTDEAREFERILRPVVENSQSQQKEVTVYLTAEKGLAPGHNTVKALPHTGEKSP